MTRRLNPGATAGASLSSSSGLGWQKHAACIGLADLFFGPDDEGPLQRDNRERRAKRVCAGCPVRWQCRSYAIAAPEKWGVWGQFGEDERAQERSKYLRRRRSYAA
jgi:WhiB family transcriptional regulator, redox-sensing transcriptional regulator